MLDIKKLRKESGYSQKEFAHITGLSVSVISRTENGKRELTEEEERKVIIALGGIPVINTDDSQTAIVPGTYTIYTDGGCAVNPGGPGGIGVVIINEDSGEETTISKGFIATTNNRMEMMAAIYGLREIPEGSDVTLISDSQYLINTMTFKWARKKNHDLWNKLDKACEGKTVTWKWVRGHNGNRYNEICDNLATEGINSPDKADDTGYAGGAAPTSKTGTSAPGGAMAVQIDVPDIPCNMPVLPVRPSCTEAIALFDMGSKSFRDYMALKVGGMDEWSNISLPELTRMAGDEICVYVRRYLPNDRQVASCLKWYGRGLSLQDSIRKVLVDEEIAANCQKTKER